MITFTTVDPDLTRELRRSVLRPGLDAHSALPGDHQPGSVHFGAVEDDAVLCTCFVYADPCPWQPGRVAWHLRQMATWPHRRGEGLGRGVVGAAAQYVRSRGAEVLWCHARETALPFYRGLGFVPHGPVFTDEEHTVPHQRMARELFLAAASST